VAGLISFVRPAGTFEPGHDVSDFRTGPHGHILLTFPDIDAVMATNWSDHVSEGNELMRQPDLDLTRADATRFLKEFD
jgi:hypothetical protein